MTTPHDVQQLLGRHGDRLVQAAAAMFDVDPTQKVVAIVVTADADVLAAGTIASLLGREDDDWIADLADRQLGIEILGLLAPQLLEKLVDDASLLPVIAVGADGIVVETLCPTSAKGPRELDSYPEAMFIAHQ